MYIIDVTNFLNIENNYNQYQDRRYSNPTLCENEKKKSKPVPILLPRASRNFSNVKTRNEIFLLNWTSEIIPFIRFDKQMDRA